MSIRLYGWPKSTAARVRWVLEERAAYETSLAIFRHVHGPFVGMLR